MDTALGALCERPCTPAMIADPYPVYRQLRKHSLISKEEDF